jgi:hypothetical protein
MAKGARRKARSERRYHQRAKRENERRAMTSPREFPVEVRQATDEDWERLIQNSDPWGRR